MMAEYCSKISNWEREVDQNRRHFFVFSINLQALNDPRFIIKLNLFFLKTLSKSD